MAESELEKRKRLAESSLAYFFRLIQDDGYIDQVHIDLGFFIQKEVEEGDTSRLLLIMPRGSFKTTFITKFFPLWLAVQNPNVRILVVSNTQPNAKQKVAEIREMVTSNPIINAMWPEIIPRGGKNDRWSDSAARLNRTATYSESTFEAAGLRTTLTGRHYDWIIEDDTVAPDLDDIDGDIVLPSREDINQAIGWHKLATPLLVDAYKGGRIVVGTRWCHEDLIQHVEDKEPTYAVFSRKAIDDNGKPLVAKFDPVALEDIKESLGSYMFSALYLNEPMRPDDMIFRPEWIIEMEGSEFPYDEEEIEWYITIDPAISEKVAACDTVILRAGHYQNRIWVDVCDAGHYTPQQTITKTLDLIELDADHTKWVGVESVAYQKALALFMRDEMMRRGVIKPIQQIKTRTNKDVRIQALQPFVERGQIIFRTGLTKLVSQMVQYPYGRLVDCVDALAMQLDSYHGFKVSKPKPKKAVKFGVTLEDVLQRVHRQKTAGNGQGLYRARSATVGTGLSRG